MIMGRVLPYFISSGGGRLFSQPYVFGTVMLLSVETMPSGKEQKLGWVIMGWLLLSKLKSIPTYYPLISPSGRGDQPLTPRSLMGFLNQANHKIHPVYPDASDPRDEFLILHFPIDASGYFILHKHLLQKRAEGKGRKQCHNDWHSSQNSRDLCDHPVRAQNPSQSITALLLWLPEKFRLQADCGRAQMQHKAHV